jgi:hypothetical protein
MNMRSALWLIVLLTLHAAVVSGQTLAPKNVTAGQAGQTLTIAGKFDGNGSWSVALQAVDTQGKAITSQEPIEPVTAKLADDKKTLTFDLPASVKEGNYQLTVQLGDPKNPEKKVSVTDRLLVSKSAGNTPSQPAEPAQPAKSPEAPVTITAVLAKSRYPNEEHRSGYDFEIDGTNFGKNLADNHVLINGYELKLTECPPGSYPSLPILSTKSGTDNKQEPIRQYDGCLRTTEPGKLIVEGYQPSEETTPPLKVAVRVGDSDKPVVAADTLLFSRVSKPSLRVYAVGSFLLIIGILFFLVRTGVKLRQRDDASFNSLMAFLVDKDTNSYSLSKFQLTLFTLVTIFGYIYIFVCRLFVQWKFELPAVPENLPTMLAVSVGTTVAAAGIGARIGGKGAGAQSPTLADMVSSGGVVMGERFQFFLWTIVSSMAVLALILASDPATIDQLPKIPEGMLYLMGLSSAGYLGGKLVRGPGPNIRSIDTEKRTEFDEKGSPPGNATVLVATLTGDNLSPTATFQLDDERIPADQVTIGEKKIDDQHPQFCSLMEVHLWHVAERFFDGPHVLRIANQDGQGAEITYGTSITSATPIDSNAKPIKLKVIGSNFKDPSRGSWEGGSPPHPTEFGVDNVRKISDTELEVTLPENAQLPGKLTITSPRQLSTTVDVK